jgi:hypothetical protein
MPSIISHLSTCRADGPSRFGRSPMFVSAAVVVVILLVCQTVRYRSYERNCKASRPSDVTDCFVLQDSI